ncbi:enkurin domain-containing protein 1-like [Limulus polyphemus]|uniref:Enkurin domain-containing protein 1-like n=1 Tax=Limulus polyphemus TaxID=6850 RepID=A0ABM1S230_LIMPO|nr:enkurin domain-containing protein 1-like [Limulus polyphemus]XP_022237686.1 enkurin domain-containing protein 1-like [Limulus polyphemus]
MAQQNQVKHLDYYSPSRIFSPTLSQILMDIENETVRKQPKPKQPPKDFTKENIKQLRAIQATHRKREQEIRKPLKATAASDKYSCVQSKVSSVVKSPSAAASPSAECSTTRTSSESGDSLLKSPEVKNCEETDKKESITQGTTVSHLRKSSSASDLTLPQEKQKNTARPKNAAQNFRAVSKSPSLTDMHHVANALKKSQKKPDSFHQLGKVPKYLIQRKQQWREEKERKLREIPDPSIPPGHSLVSEAERQETLTILQQNKQELLKTLSTLPIRNDTLRLRNKKEELEQQLAKIEEGIAIFSRPRVLIKNDA